MSISGKAAAAFSVASLATAVFVGSAALVVANPAHHPITIKVTASNWAFNPTSIHVKVGQPTTLHLTSTYGVHGIQNAELGIPHTVIKPSEPVDVTFTATKVGTYHLACTVFCGAPHSKMRLEVDVMDAKGN